MAPLRKGMANNGKDKKRVKMLIRRLKKLQEGYSSLKDQNDEIVAKFIEQSRVNSELEAKNHKLIQNVMDCQFTTNHLKGIIRNVDNNVVNCLKPLGELSSSLLNAKRLLGENKGESSENNVFTQGASTSSTRAQAMVNPMIKGYVIQHPFVSIPKVNPEQLHSMRKEIRSTRALYNENDALSPIPENPPNSGTRRKGLGRNVPRFSNRTVNSPSQADETLENDASADNSNLLPMVRLRDVSTLLQNSSVVILSQNDMDNLLNVSSDSSDSQLRMTDNQISNNMSRSDSELSDSNTEILNSSDSNSSVSNQTRTPEARISKDATIGIVNANIENANVPGPSMVSTEKQITQRTRLRRDSELSISNTKILNSSDSISRVSNQTKTPEVHISNGVTIGIRNANIKNANVPSPSMALTEKKLILRNRLHNLVPKDNTSRRDSKLSMSNTETLNVSDSNSRVSDQTRTPETPIQNDTTIGIGNANIENANVPGPSRPMTELERTRLRRLANCVPGKVTLRNSPFDAVPHLGLFDPIRDPFCKGPASVMAQGCCHKRRKAIIPDDFTPKKKVVKSEKVPMPTIKTEPRSSTTSDENSFNNYSEQVSVNIQELKPKPSTPTEENKSSAGPSKSRQARKVEKPEDTKESTKNSELSIGDNNNKQTYPDQEPMKMSVITVCNPP